jgi:hypothetical protein
LPVKIFSLGAEVEAVLLAAATRPFLLPAEEAGPELF